MAGSVQPPERQSRVEPGVSELLNSLPEGAILLDSEWRIVLSNSAFQRLFSATPDQLEGQFLWERAGAKWDVPELRRLLNGFGKQGSCSPKDQLSINTPSGTRFFDLSASVVQTPAGDRILVVLYDATARVRAEESCRQSEDRFRRFVDSLTDYAVIFFDPAGNIVRWNSGAQALFLWDPDEVVGKPASITFTPEDVAIGAPDMEIQTATKTGRAEDERWHIRKNGERFFASGVLTTLRDDRGNLLGFTKVLRDVTRRHQAEVERERLLNERHALLDSAGEGIFGVDLHGRCTFINASALGMLGFTPQECIGKDIHSLAHHHYADGRPYPRSECPVYRAASEGTDAHVTGDVVWRRDGSSFPAEYTVRPVRVEGRIEGAVVTLRDVSVEREAAERLAQKRRQLEELTHTLDLAQSMIRELDGTITFWSSGAEQLYGFTKQEAVGQISHTLLHTYSATPLDDILTECLAEGQWHGELRHTRKDGAVIWVTSYWAIHEDQASGANKVIEVNNDITARRRAEDAMRRTNEALERFAYAASHDLKEPLRTITSYLQLLDRRYRDTLDADAKEFIRLCVDGAQRMRELIDSLLAYARAGTDQGMAAPIKAGDALENAVANLQAAISETKARIEVVEPLPAVRIHAGQLSQIFQNLLSNCIKYRKPDVSPLIHVSAESTDAGWRFRVRDNGIGFAATDADRIFGLFRRLHGRDVPGTGVGLALARRIVEHYGGQIWAEGQPGLGATFYFTLPA
jgi:PAS domain S-box-containing protein